MSYSTVSRRVRAAAAATAVVMGAAGLAVLTAATATAAPHFADARSVQIGHTDSADHKTPFDYVGGRDMPLGAWTDGTGRVHVSRVYATFDVTQFAGKTLGKASVFIGERTVADCTKRAIEIWSTDTIEKSPSWADAPAVEVKVDEETEVRFCPGTLTFDVKAAVEHALAKGKPRVSFEIRVPEGVEKDVSFGRTLSAYRSVQLTVEYNSLPSIDPQHRYNGGFPCTPSAPYRTLGWNSLLQVRALDADGTAESRIKYDFAVWPKDDPTARLELSRDWGNTTFFSGVEVPENSLVDGRTYLWQARASDGAATSPWSEPCGFVIDRTNSSTPAVTSSNYPPNGSEDPAPIGEPGVFTFSAGGDLDTAGFEYTWSEFGVAGCTQMEYGRLSCPDPLDGHNVVRADAPGGSATVALTPDRSGSVRLRVRSVDVAGNRSEPAQYEVFVPWADPGIALVGGEPEWNKPFTLRFTPYPGVTGTVEFEYRFNNRDPQVVPAGADGTATATFLADTTNLRVTVRSRSTNGWVSPESSWSHYIGPWPVVNSDIYPKGEEPSGGVGVTGTFTFSPPPGWTEIQGYRYSFAWDAEPVFVAAGADGRASITWTPQESGAYYLEVYPVRPDGTNGDYSAYYWFQVA